MDNKFKLKGNKLYIFPLSDLHLGSPNCNLEYFEYWKEIFKKTHSKNKIIYLLGDLIDFQSIKIGAWEVERTADDQILSLLELLKPYKKHIRYMVSGNHPKRAKKDYNLDIGKIIADNLNVKYSSADFFDTLKINNEKFTVYGMHGVRFSNKQKLAEKNFIDDMNSINANLCLQGHNHYGCGFDSILRSNTGLSLKYYGFTGHFLSYFNSYAHQRASSPSPECFMRFSVNKSLKVDWNKYNIINERPDLMEGFN